MKPFELPDGDAMMIDFSIEAERDRGIAAREAIFQACLKRFRPITMTPPSSP